MANNQVFADGAEWGMLFHYLDTTSDTEYEGVHLLNNQEYIFAMAQKCGWRIVDFRQSAWVKGLAWLQDAEGIEWFWMKLEKA